MKNLRDSKRSRVKHQGQDEKEEQEGGGGEKVRILAANKAYYSLQTPFRSKRIQQNNKIRLHKTLLRPAFCYGSVTWTPTQITTNATCI
jgi:hypothetical protein